MFIIKLKFNNKLNENSLTDPFYKKFSLRCFFAVVSADAEDVVRGAPIY